MQSQTVIALIASLTTALAAQAQSTKGAQPAYKDPNGLVKHLRHELEEFESGGETQITALGTLIVVREQVGGWTLNRKTPLRILSVENGTATVKGRELPAAIVTAELGFVNRAEAKYDVEKVYYAAVSDTEFEVWRAPQFCHGEDMDKELAEWRTAVAFKPTKATSEPLK